MELITNIVFAWFFGLAVPLFIAGFRCSLKGGPGPYELVGMLWRCEIKSKYPAPILDR